jgi:hypothetical protein
VTRSSFEVRIFERLLRGSMQLVEHVGVSPLGRHQSRPRCLCERDAASRMVGMSGRAGERRAPETPSARTLSRCRWIEARLALLHACYREKGGVPG